MLAKLKHYLAPGLVFQAVVVGAGYATGRELVQFFMTGSLVSGLLGMLVTALVWSITLAIAFWNARAAAASDYRIFLRSTIGPLWIIYEICFLALLILVLSVLASAAGEIVHSRLGWPTIAGTGLLMGAICLLVFFGTGLIQRFLAAWSVLLYVLFGLVLLICLTRYGGTIAANIQQGAPEPQLFQQGLSYAGYNLAILPGILYCVRHLESDREALIAGGLAGIVAMVPAAIFFLSMAAFWPDVAQAPVPIDLMLERIDLPWLSALFYVALFGIFIKTGAALIHAVNERVAGSLLERDRTMPAAARSGLALATILCATVLADRIGIIDLIKNGYSVLTNLFLIFFVFPLVIMGTWKIMCQKKQSQG